MSDVKSSQRRIFDGGYIDCLWKNTVLTNEKIVRVNGTGVITDSGNAYKADVIVSWQSLLPFGGSTSLTGKSDYC
jgi:hypothetical protein